MRGPVVVIGVAAWLMAIATASADDVRQPDKPPPPKPIGVITKQPKLLQAVAPEYPPAALAAGKEAKGRVRIRIDDTGTVSKVHVVEHVRDRFDDAPVSAAMQYGLQAAEI